MAHLFDNRLITILGAGGDIEPGARLHWYLEGTTTPVTTFANEGLSVANPNPVIADANGRFGAIWLPDNIRYKFVATSADGATTYVTQDPYVTPEEVPTISAGLENFLAGSGPLPVANGGTGQATAVNALAALGGLPLAGGTVTGNIARSSKGVHHYWDAATLVNGGWFLTPDTDPDPTTLPGQVWVKYVA